MLTMEPPPLSSIPGSTARTVRYMAFTFSSKEKSQSFSSQSRMLPWAT